VARHRAASAADLAALAAASRAASGSAVACAAARSTVQAAGARVISCTLDGAVAVVAIALRPPGWLGTLGEAQGRARAGLVELGR
jgi:secretion/DNA translocation related TadE-like protein